MIVRGIGNDIVKLARFEKIITSRSSNHLIKFTNRFLNENYELPIFIKFYKEYTKKPNSFNLQQLTHLLSNSWCVKELCYKSLSLDQQRDFKFKEWYKINDTSGRPILLTTNTQFKDEFLTSLSHDGDYVISTVLRQSD